MKKLILFLIAISILISCKEKTHKPNNKEKETISAKLHSDKKKTKKRLLPSPSGRANEVLIVMNDKYWNSKSGQFLFNSFTQDVEGIAWKEPIFDISRIPRGAYNDMVRIARNLIEVDVSDRYSIGKVKLYRAKYSRTQAYAKIQAPNEETLYQTINDNEIKLLSFFYSAERERLITYFEKNPNNDFQEKLKEKLGYNVVIPTMFNHENFNGINFVWLSGGNIDARADLALYTFPCNEEKIITLQYLIAKRDSVMKINIPGPSDGSYMCTENSLPTTFKKVKINNKTLYEVRGLWKTTIDIMGGPFVSYAYYNEETQTMQVLEGFVYAPNHNKRNLIHRIEAVAYSWKP